MSEVCATALKEWAAVCQALATGRQIILLRKGGIAEGPGGFQAEHEAFWLLPTYFHERPEALKPDDRSFFELAEAAPAGDRVRIELFARVVQVVQLAREELLDRLIPQHIYGAQTIHDRFHYRRPGLWLMAVRVYRGPATELPVWPELAGCHSWAPLPAPLPTDRVSAVLDDRTFGRRLADLRTVLA